MSRENLVGQKFGRLTVIASAESRASWTCRCDCGTTYVARAGNLKSGATASCGCIRRERNNHTTHGGTGTLAHKSWRAMRARCLNTKASNYKNYGGRGITICERWSDFANFLADMGECPDGHTIERQDRNGPYAPGNCHWASRKAQNRNTSRNRELTHNGETLCVSQWAERTGIKAQTILNRLLKGWSTEQALTETGDARANRKRRTP